MLCGLLLAILFVRPLNLSLLILLLFCSPQSLKMRKMRTTNVANGRLRLNIFRSNNHIYGQVINDVEHRTLAAASTKSLKLDKGGDTEAASAAGKALGELCKSKGIEKLFYDRQSTSHKYTYHGRIKAFVEGVREGGVEA